MEVRRQARDDDTAGWAEWHKLLVAEDGFSMLSLHADRHGLDAETIRQFAEEVNRRNEPGSLHPRALISAMPRRYFRNSGLVGQDDAVARLRKDVGLFLDANQATIRATRLLVDFRVSANPIPAEYLEITEGVIQEHGQRAGFIEVVIFE